MELSNQKKELKSEIIKGESNNKFQVYNIEASEGKTTVAEKAVAMSYIQTGRKSIFVRKFIKDCESTVENVNWHSKDYGLNEEIAITLNSTNQRKIKSNLNLSDIPIIVITHQKYKQLCLDVYELKLFTEGRTNLIIDEEVDMLESITFSKEIYREFLSHLPEENNYLRKLYISYAKEILDLINTGHRNKVDSFTKDFAKFKSKELKQFKKIINSLEFDDYFFQSFPNSITQLNALTRKANNLKPGMLSKRVKHIINSCTMTKSKFLKHLDDLMRMYTNTYVLMNEFGNMKIHTYDDSYYWWKLENNILLDANGGFNYIYELSNDFVLKNYYFNTDHSNWLINFYKVKTSKKQKNKYMNYYKKVNNLLNNISNNKSKTLLISNKKEYLSDNYDARNNNFISHDYFGNLIGSNAYRDYSSIVIAHTPYLPSYVYILKYLFYQEDRGAIENIDIRYNHKAKFKNPELEKIKHSTMLGELYQTIKRINRDNDKDAHVHLMIHDNKLLSGIIKLLKNSRVHMINLDIKQKNDRKLSYDGKRFNNSKAKMLKLEIEKFAKEDNFSISKKYLKKSISCSSQKFSKIINHPEVQKCITENAITIKYHSIEKTS